MPCSDPCTYRSADRCSHTHSRAQLIDACIHIVVLMDARIHIVVLIDARIHIVVLIDDRTHIVEHS